MFSHSRSSSSSRSSHKADTDTDADNDDMQVKGLRRVVRRLRRSFRKLGHAGVGHHRDHHPTGLVDARVAVAGVDSPLLVDIARDSPSLPITIPVFLAPKTTTISESFTASEDELLGRAQISDGSSMTSESQTSSAESSEAAPVIDQSHGLEPHHGHAMSENTDTADLPQAVVATSRQFTFESETEEPPSTLDSRFDASSGAAVEEDIISPPLIAEPEVPDPFIVDDSDEPSSDEEGSSDNAEAPGLSANRPEQALVASEIALAQSGSQELAIVPEHPLSSADVYKDVPPPPAADSSDEEEAPEIYAPGLIIPTMFLPIPNTDSLSTLLTKYVSPEKRPARDLTGDWQRTDFHTLVMTNSWRALARMARDRIVEADPEDLTLILSLWSLRLSSLARLRLFNQTSAECTNLFNVLNAIEPPAARQWVFDRILPFELEVLHSKIKYWAGDHMGYLDALTSILKRCKSKARQAKADATTATMWQERGSRICLIIASQLIEMKELTAAAKLIEPLCSPKFGVTVPSLRSAVGRIYLQSGYISLAAMHFAAVSEDPSADMSMKDMNAALQASAEGDWTGATDALRNVLASNPENYVAVNDLAVVLLCQGRLQEAIQILEEALKHSPSNAVVAEPFLFNLSTLYELRATFGVERKRDLLIEVAKWSGDGLRTTCLKMPTS